MTNYNILKLSRYSKYMILFGLKVLGFILGYGLFFISYSALVNEILTKSPNLSYADGLKLTIPAVPTIGVLILVFWILWTTIREPKCQHCGKKLLDDINIGVLKE